ncbi:hypothetical protein DL96DRAFT_1569433 [Flagelloscypha sp. PMI_526]|nr:hypothetical protein DL96DRAFT_1569433 [Flagelloscypha sp. PMI_526]
MSNSPEFYTLSGSCHCGTVKFIAKGVNLSTICKCNCTYDVGVLVSLPVISSHDESPEYGWKVCNFDFVLRGPEDVLLLKGDEQIPLNVMNVTTFEENGLRTYMPYPERFKAGSHEVGLSSLLQLVYSYLKSSVQNVDVYGGESISVSARLLDFGAIGKDLKDLTDPKKMAYVDGLTDKFGMQKGEPWSGGAW